MDIVIYLIIKYTKHIEYRLIEIYDIERVNPFSEVIFKIYSIGEYIINFYKKGGVNFEA